MSITTQELSNALRPAANGLKKHVDHAEADTNGTEWDGDDWADYLAAFARPAVEALLTNAVCPMDHFPPEGFETVDARVEEAVRETQWAEEARSLAEAKLEEAEVEVSALQQELLNVYRQLYNTDPR